MAALLLAGIYGAFVVVALTDGLGGYYIPDELRGIAHVVIALLAQTWALMWAIEAGGKVFAAQVADTLAAQRTKLVTEVERLFREDITVRLVRRDSHEQEKFLRRVEERFDTAARGLINCAVQRTMVAKASVPVNGNGNILHLTPRGD